MDRFLFLPIVLGLAGLAARGDDAAERLEALKTVFATQPRDYPTGRGDAQPDHSVPFRWHGYHADARMTTHVEPYNPPEDAGVSADAPSRTSAVGWPDRSLRYRIRWRGRDESDMRSAGARELDHVGQRRQAACGSTAI